MKASSYIEYPDAVKLIDTALEAWRLEVPWNCFITVHLQSVGIKPEDCSKYFRDGLQRLRRYHERHNMPFTCGWVLESHGYKGVHAHLLLHRPKDLPMGPHKYRWDVLKRFKLPNQKGVLKVKKFYSFQSYETNLKEALRYCLKGLRPDALEYMDLPISLTKQGKVMGKRIGQLHP